MVFSIVIFIIIFYNLVFSYDILYSHITLRDDALRTLDVLHLKGLRSILGLRPTYIDRANTNQKVLDLAEAEMNKNTVGDHAKWKKINLVSVTVKQRSLRESGEILRLSNDDIRRIVTFRRDGADRVLPELNRVGKPRTHWALVAMGRAWEEIDLHNRSEATKNKTSDYRNEIHLNLLMEATLME